MKIHFQLNYRSKLKKGNQFLKLTLGWMNDIKDLAQNFISNILKLIKDISLILSGIFVWLPIQIKKLIVFLWNLGRNIWKNIKNPFYTTLGILTAIFCVSLALFFVFVLIGHINPTFIASLKSQYILTSDKYQPETAIMLNQLIAQGQIIKASDIYNHMLEYYNTLITLLIALLGIFGFISWFSIQAKVKQETELSVDNKFENKDFQCRLEKEMEKTATRAICKEEYLRKIVDENLDTIISKLLCCTEFTNIIKELIQNTKDDKNIKLEPLAGIKDGD